MKYYIDLDNTLCQTENKDYNGSKPIYERIRKVNELKESGHYVCIWTGRGSVSGIDYTELTRKQLSVWGVQYDKLLLGKPDYDVYYDDKSHNVDNVWKLPSETINTKKGKPIIVNKGWGHEVVIANFPEYCGKVLHFEPGKKFSMHYHVRKMETWYVFQGTLHFHWIDPETGKTYTEMLTAGDTVTNARGVAHQLTALTSADVFEVSTTHCDSDSYRICKGD